MCTLIAIKGRADCPLVLAANRDEFYARPATPPRMLSAAPRVFGGLDVDKGGTWVAVSERGHFVALTNQRTFEAPDPSRASRGKLVLEAASQPTWIDVDNFLCSVDPRKYNSFNLLYGNARELKVLYGRSDSATAETYSLPDGVWVLSNDRLGSREFPKTLHAEALVHPLLEAPLEDLLSALEVRLGDHHLPPDDAIVDPPAGSPFDRALVTQLQALCVHTPRYGTRSATVLALRDGSIAHYRFADGPPCVTRFEDVAMTK